MIAVEGLQKRAALSRFLGKPVGEIDRMMEEDGLPYVNLPGGSKPCPRFFLPDVHRWLCKYAKGEGEAVGKYDDFRRAFEAAQPGKKGVSGE